MKRIKQITGRARLFLITGLTSLVMLSACGGVESVDVSGIGGTGIAFGRINGFGSVFVNGVEFETDGSQFIVDGNLNATEDDLALGMVVRLEFRTENGVVNGSAINVIYDDEVEGPVVATPVVEGGSGGTRKTFNVFGQTITIDQTDTVFDATSFDTIDAMDLVEVSGFRSSASEITASYVRKTGVLIPGVSEVELRGTIMNYDEMLQTFMLDGSLIRFDAMTEIEAPSGVLSDGLYVEVEGVIQVDLSIFAEKIEHEEQDFDDYVDNISLQGIIAEHNSLSDFEINGLPIDASQAELTPADAESLLENGINVEVEGDIVNGVLIADELEIREGSSKLRAFVGFVDAPNNWFEVDYPAGSVVVRTDAQTLFEDETGVVPSRVFSIIDLVALDFVRIEGREVNDEIIASTVKRTDADDSELQGTVDSFKVDISITILDITYLVDLTPGTGTIFEEGSMNSAAFFAQLQIGDIVEIKDVNPVDGIANEVGFED